jgi:hypothetical protein
MLCDACCWCWHITVWSIAGLVRLRKGDSGAPAQRDRRQNLLLLRSIPVLARVRWAPRLLLLTDILNESSQKKCMKKTVTTLRIPEKTSNCDRSIGLIKLQAAGDIQTALPTITYITFACFRDSTTTGPLDVIIARPCQHASLSPFVCVTTCHANNILVTATSKPNQIGSGVAGVHR